MRLAGVLLTSSRSTACSSNLLGDALEIRVGLGKRIGVEVEGLLASTILLGRDRGLSGTPTPPSAFKSGAVSDR
jgi:hypothetical protein